MVLDSILDEHLSFKKIAYVNLNYDVLPCEGVVVERKIVSDEDEWSLVKLDEKISIPSVFYADYVMIRAQETGVFLKKGEKTIIAFCLISNELALNSKEIERSDLTFG